MGAASVTRAGLLEIDGLKFYLGDYKPRHIARPGDLIVANTEQGFDHLLIGYSALIPAWVGKEGLFSHHIFKVEPRPASPLSRVWLHFALSASSFVEAIPDFPTEPPSTCFRRTPLRYRESSFLH